MIYLNLAAEIGFLIRGSLEPSLKNEYDRTGSSANAGRGADNNYVAM